MVISRANGGAVDNFKSNFKTYLNTFGNEVTLQHQTETKDSMGRVIDISTTETTIKADIQFVTQKDLRELPMGDLEIGDAMLYCEVGVNISIHDLILAYDVTWQVGSKVEAERVNGKEVYQAFTLRRK